MAEYNILLVDTDIQIRSIFRWAIERMEDMCLFGETGQESEAILFLNTGNIDVMILELELEEGSGVHLLSEIKNLQIRKPFTIILTNVRSPYIIEAIREEGADYVCLKNNLKNRPETVLEIIHKSMRFMKSTVVDDSATKEYINRICDEHMLEEKVTHALRNMQFSPKNLGTTYLREAIVYIMLNPHISLSMTKQLYPLIAEKYDTTPKSVERNIRTSIEKVWLFTNVSMLDALYDGSWNLTTGRPTNKEFIYHMAELLDRQKSTI